MSSKCVLGLILYPNPINNMTNNINMKRNNSKVANKRDRKGRSQNARANRRNVNDGILGMPTAWPGSSAVTPGRAYVRMVTEVFPTLDTRHFNKAGFATWSSQVSGILAPYKYFRIVRADAEVVLNGGAASTFSVAFNISNAYTTDTTVTSILNDDYSGVSTAMIRPKLAPPASYWAGRPMDWYAFALTTDPGLPPANTVTAGGITLSGSGSAVPTDVIGYLLVDFVIEFHTLL